MRECAGGIVDEAGLQWQIRFSELLSESCLDFHVSPSNLKSFLLLSYPLLVRRLGARAKPTEHFCAALARSGSRLIYCIAKSDFDVAPRAICVASFVCENALETLLK